MIINPNVKSLSDDTVQRFIEVEPATVGHFCNFGFVNQEYKTSLENVRLAGRAVTLKIPSLDSTLCHKVIEMAGPGDVIVVDRCGDSKHACWGAAVTVAAKAAGINGAIVDGAVTDILDIKREQFHVFYQRLSALTTKLLGIDGEINTPVNFGGVTVNPGDLVLADVNGIVIIPPKDAELILEKALFEQHKEIGQFQKLREGMPLAALSGANRFLEKDSK